MALKILELFCGTKSFSKAADELGHETFTIDIEKKFNPSLCKDIMQVTSEEIIEKFGNPDIIWASPPCTYFSIATHRHWENQQPKPETIEHIKLLHHTLGLIFSLHPKFWILENPKGRMRWIMGNPPNSVCYGAYGSPVRKETDLWGFYPKIKFRQLTEKKGNWSYAIGRDAKSRGIIPKELCLEILRAIENANTHNSKVTTYRNTEKQRYIKAENRQLT